MTLPIARLAYASATEKIAVKSRAKLVEAIKRCKEIKNGEKWLSNAITKIKDLLDHKGPLTAREIGKTLPELVVPLTFGSGKNTGTMNAHSQLLQLGGYEGVFVRGTTNGGWVSGEYLWSSSDSWIDESITGADVSESAAELLQLWLNQFGPASLTDIRWYFGWTAKLAKDALSTIEADNVILENGSDAYVAAGDTGLIPDPGPWVQLLPGLDATTMGWKEREFYFDADSNAGLFDRSGNAGPTVWCDGEVVGSWIQRPDKSIAYHLNRKISRHHQKLLKEAIERTAESCGDVVVRPRFPAPIQKTLLNR